MEDIFSSHAVSQDYLECSIFIGASANRWEPVADKDKLEKWELKLFMFIQDKIGGYIWNREPFRLFVNMYSKVPCISGRMVHGDSIDDEWLVVWLLLEATKTFPEIIVSVHDADGEFLLAEAAMHIPLWLTPENSANRVFIHREKLCIVSHGICNKGRNTLNDREEKINLEDALSYIANPTVDTSVPEDTTNAAFSRVKSFPSKLTQCMHRAQCILPVRVAYAIVNNPQLTAAATELFYGRDPLQTKLFQQMENFSPKPSVMMSVCFNRSQYAKLVSQNINPPHVFQIPPASSAEHKACVLGMKLSESYKEFMKKLDDIGYFSNLLADSQQYQDRLVAAEWQFQTRASFKNNIEFSEERLAEEAYHFLERSISGVSCGQALKRVEGRTSDIDEDESWLELHPDELDALMKNAESILHDYKGESQDKQCEDHKLENKNTKLESDSAQGLREMLEKFETFLMTNSGVDGTMEYGESFEDDAEDVNEDVDLDPNSIIDTLLNVVGTDMDTISGLIDEKGNIKKTDSPNKDAWMEGVGSYNDEDGDGDDDDENNEERLPILMAAMDSELSSSKVGKSFVKNGDQSHEEGNNNDSKSLENLDNVNIDLNLVENIVESFRSQQGLPGPAGTMLGQFGIHLPRIDSDESSDAEK